MVRVVLPASSSNGILKPNWRTFADHPQHITEPHVLWEGGQPIAIGSLARNPIHPQPLHFRWLLAEGNEPDCLTQLLESLVSDPSRRGSLLHLTVGADDEATNSWARGNGFEPVMTTRIGSLALPTQPFIPSIVFQTLGENDTPEIRSLIATLHAAIYRQQHEWNPPAPFTSEGAESLFLDKVEMIPDKLWIATNDNEQPVGVSSLRRTPVSDELDFGWIGVLNGVSDHVHQLLFETAINAAVGQTLLLEVDESDQRTIGHLRELPVVWGESIIRLERPEIANPTHR